ncbi:hypothetical protein ACFL2J_07070 [Candidatus Omnitrophota bacterium]
MKISKNHSILALGADIKSRYCVIKDNRLILSKDFGNLDEYDNLEQFQSSISRLKTRFKTVAFDSHPGYFSSGLADSINAKKKISVQHHHAHIAAALSVQQIKGPVIGVAFDGTGYGTDGNIWGGEFMVADASSFRRVAHFQYLGMPGAELVVKEPWRMAFSLLYNCFGEEVFEQDLELLKLYPRMYYNILSKMLKQNINSPLTSSVGRLFDAVSSILGVCHKVKYEAEAAVQLEKLASKSKESSYYHFDVMEKDGVRLISHHTMVKRILSDMKNGLPKEDIARKFHNSLSVNAAKLINRIGQEYNLEDVVLSGGVFVNRLLFDSLSKKIREMGYNLIIDAKVPVNDLSICLGQAYIALQKK